MFRIITASLAGAVFAGLCLGQGGPPDLSKIQQIVFIIKENRSFDHYFGTFPGVDGATSALLSTGQVMPMGHSKDYLPADVCHNRPCTIPAMDYGKMDQFDLQQGCFDNGQYVCLSQFTQADIPNYWTYATQFTLADRMFSSLAGSSFPNHLYMISATSGGVIDQGTLNSSGCQAAQTYTAPVMDLLGNIANVYPCFDFLTLGDLLSTAGVNWKAYGGLGTSWNAYTAINHYYNTSLWSQHIFGESQFVTDALAGNLPAVSWLVTVNASEHAPAGTCIGENWTVNQINAIMQGP